ncbi:MAG: SDR family NAD(P)-dependent oxidoreductase [Microbacterium sp.]|nr:MAG: SDR family NAD(P)-dependent oxidoreductase [Microbacterium sp.]
MSDELEGRVAIITGAAGQYGRHISRALAGAGATVVVASRRLDACEEFAAELRDEGGSAIAAAVDQGDEASITGFVAEVKDRLGRIDVLVNNAVLRRGGEPEKTSYADWEATTAVNSTGLFWLTRLVAEQMATSRCSTTPRSRPPRPSMPSTKPGWWDSRATSRPTTGRPACG